MASGVSMFCLHCGLEAMICAMRRVEKRDVPHTASRPEQDTHETCAVSAKGRTDG